MERAGREVTLVHLDQGRHVPGALGPGGLGPGALGPGALGEDELEAVSGGPTEELFGNLTYNGLHTGAGIIQNDGSYTLVANYTGINKLSGPHKSIADIDSQLAGDHKIVDQRWGAYYPPCYY